ncbi:DUF1800 domain-containing protein [Polymorphobacter sp. PAMC 29334]|uniref:DUF1800 domain-containing protein n=1 Tax=Polymorphobacter sp. PAMC 29334 TaxID=2862331 RepID=UPI001C677970|nr:DUF1800 domain-containing protein [Polymorphobacter sp. PAMC 29334]QYE36602.1 DUF1800 domain-containing protein [Polymorphobacter sp. PAMC 29334]
MRDHLLLPWTMLAVLLATAAPVAAAPARITPSQAALLDRLTWGTDASDAEAIAHDGTARWLDHQLHPARTTALPAEVAARIAALPVTKTPMADAVRQAEDLNRVANAMADPDAKAAAKKVYNDALGAAGHQAATRSILLALYSPDQLQEVMTWFWFNHFNVHLGKNNIRLMIGDYEQAAIRPHALGRFRDLLEATVRHPAMLSYLDNAQNANGHINENYAREIMELHTMGVGSGYSQKDVQELARILTGVGIDAKPDDPKIGPQHAGDLVRQGLFEFNPNRHDYGDKDFLGHHIAGRGFAEVEEALDILSEQPATAHHVSMALARQFVGDVPPPRLVDRMAATFVRTHGEIAPVMAMMIGSPEFKASLGTKFKDPAHYVLSAVRLAYDDRIVVNTQPVEGWLNRLAEGLYNHQTPDGYPPDAAAWNGPGQMSVRFEIARQIGGGAPALFKPEGAPPPPPPVPGVPPTPQPPVPVSDMRSTVAALFPAPDAATTGALAQAKSPAEFYTLFLSSPRFMRR